MLARDVPISIPSRGINNCTVINAIYRLVHYLQQKGSEVPASQKYILKLTQKPLQVTEHVMEVSITTNMNGRENAEDSMKHLYTASNFKSGIYKIYWLLKIICISLVHRKPMKPMNAKNKVIKRVGTSTEAC